jgi:hypothetical protein
MVVALAANAERTGRQGLASVVPARVAWLCCALFAALLAMACNRADVPKPRLESVVQHSYEVTIHQPARLGRVKLGALPSTPAAGAVSQPASAEPAPRNTAVRCETCHALRPPVALPASMRELDQFHQGLELQHGALSCASCHTQGASITLHLADGRKLPPGGAMDLCRQCHGTQYRDYGHGAHGGMSGYWDLSRGARVRNHCIDCHDPHAPQIRQVLPAAPPRDRFFGGQATASSATATSARATATSAREGEH